MIQGSRAHALSWARGDIWRAAARVAGWLGMAGAALAVAYPLALRPWHLRWGASDEEAQRTLPGDDLVPRPVVQSTRAITINSPASAVWAWLAQLGQGRGGFYSFVF